jgi:hypothetical protein
MSTTATTKNEVGECGNHPEDDHPYTVSSTERVRE